MHLMTDFIHGFFDVRLTMLNTQIRFLKEQNMILREHLPQSRLTFTSRQKQRLLRYDKLLGCKAKEILTIVHTTTWYRWKRQQYENCTRPTLRIGRPPKITEAIKQLVTKIVTMNFSWGYPKIMSELKKIGIDLSSSSIRNILKKEGFQHFPRHSEGTWDQYLKRTFHTLWACDFFSKTIWTPIGLRYYFVLFFINIKTREVHIAGISRKPNRKWILKQLKAMNVKFNPTCRRSVLIRDRDGKFDKSFDQFFEDQKVTVIKTPFRSPNLNPYAESWVATVKRECLNHFFVFGKIHLDYLLEEFVNYYNNYRPHSGNDHQPLAEFKPQEDGEICFKSILGGLHHHYYRKKARK